MNPVDTMLKTLMGMLIICYTIGLFSSKEIRLGTVHLAILLIFMSFSYAIGSLIFTLIL